MTDYFRMSHGANYCYVHDFMNFIVILAVLLSMPSPTMLHKIASKAAIVFNEKCLKQIPQETSQFNSIASLVCGKPLPDADLKRNLLKTSLIHIFIVSGSHLILIDALLSILKIPLLFRILFLGGYSLCVGWQAPAVRAFVGLILKEFFKLQSFFYPPDFIVLLTGFFCLFLFPNWWSSISFVMSWCAALALTIPNIFRIKKPFLNTILAQFSIFLFMGAPLWGFGSLHPLNIIYNLLLAPLVAFVLFPLSFLSILSVSCLRAFEYLMNFFNFTLSVLSEPIELTKTSQLSIFFLWGWVAMLHTFLHFLRLNLWQGNDSK